MSSCGLVPLGRKHVINAGIAQLAPPVRPAVVPWPMHVGCRDGRSFSQLRYVNLN